MNILIFAGRILYGGGEKIRNWLAKELVKAGHKVFFAIPQQNIEYSVEMEKAGLGGIVIPILYPSHIKKKKIVSYWKIVREIYKEYQIDLIIIFGGSLIEQLVAKVNGTKILLSERFFNGFRPFFSRLLKQLQFRVADGYVFQTSEASKTYGKSAERKSIVIPNPIIDKLPFPQFNNLRKEIVTAGRLMPQKDHKTLVNAFALFNKKHADYKLIIYGSGPLKNELEQQILNLGLSDVITVITGKTRLIELERGCEMFVLSSLAEGMPNALIEAMSMGILCVSTDCPIYGPRMLINNMDNGILVPVGDANAMCEAMCVAVENNELAESIRHNAVKIREFLDEERIFNKWNHYILSLFEKA